MAWPYFVDDFCPKARTAGNNGSGVSTVRVSWPILDISAKFKYFKRFKDSAEAKSFSEWGIVIMIKKGPQSPTPPYVTFRDK